MISEQSLRRPRSGICAALYFFFLAISPAQASLLVTNATLLTMKPGETEPIVGYMLVDDAGRIAALGSGAPPAGTSATMVLDAAKRIIIPVFISAHSHA